MTCRVALLHDHSLIGWSLERMIAQRPSLEIVLQHSLSPDAAPELTRLCPDVVVMDVSHRTGLAIGCVRGVSEDLSSARLMVLVSGLQERLVHELVSRGISSVVMASDRVEEIGACLDATAGGSGMHSAAVLKLIERASEDEDAETGSSMWDRLGDLTKREHQVLCMISEGKSKRRIADELGLSVKTVDNHATSLMNKLDIHDRVRLARLAFREGLVEP